jgi:Class II flagellar assembly regulator
MKVGGPGPARPPAPGRRSERAGQASSGQFARALENGVGEAEAVHGSAPVSALDALLAVQEVNPDGRKPRRAVLRGKALLDSLDTIRDALLSGTLSVERLSALRDLVAADRESVDDPQLSELLDEIDLRAQVELAKLTHHE